jgi:amidase
VFGIGGAGDFNPTCCKLSAKPCTCAFTLYIHQTKTTTKKIEDAQTTTDADVAAAATAHDALLASAASFFGRYDLLLAPTASLAPFPVEQPWPREIAGRPMDNFIDWLLIAGGLSLLGCPVVAVPCGVTSAGLPVGLAIAGPPGAEARVLGAAAAFEAAHPWRGHVPRDPAALPS